MKCDLCNRPAVVHEVTVKGGMKKEVHLCETHAQEAGIQLPGQQPLNQILAQFAVSKAGKATRTVAKPCGGCGMTFTQFRQNGRVGCAQCYQVFEAELSPLIERAQGGATHHCGKAPRRAGTSIDRQLLIQRLVKELDHAVAAEQYERAAELRDRLNSLDLRRTGTGQPAADKPKA